MNKIYDGDLTDYDDPNNPDFWVDSYLDESTGITYKHRVWDRDKVILICNKVVLRYMPIKDFNLVKHSMKKLEVKIR